MVADEPPIHPTAREVFVAWMPYILLVVFVLAWGFKPLQQILNTATAVFPWPWLHKEIQRMPPIVGKPSPYAAMFTMNWLSAAGTSCMFAALVSAVVLRFSFLTLLKLLVVGGAPTALAYDHRCLCDSHGVCHELLRRHGNVRVWLLPRPVRCSPFLVRCWGGWAYS